MTRSLIVLLVVTATANAGPHDDGNAVDSAKAHFARGKAAEKAGQFAQAADEFEAAYALDPRPEMLFNIGQAFLLAGAKAEALSYFQRYLEAQPDGAGAAEARKQVAALGKEVTPAPKPEPAAPAAPAPAPAPAVAVAGAPVSVTVEPIEQPASPRLRIAGLATAGAGLVALGFGVTFALDARSDADQLTHHTGAWTDADRTLYANGQAANRDMVISYVAASGLIIAGGVLYALGARTVQVSVAPSPSGAAAAVAGRF